jgi:hypothetical protein
MYAEGNTALAEEFHEPLADVLSRVVGVLAEMARLVDHNQSLIARVTWKTAATDPSYVAAMQEADLVSQKLDGVAGFLRAISNALPPDFRVETQRATDDLLLAELTHKIGARGGEKAQDAGEGAGEFDLF